MFAHLWCREWRRGSGVQGVAYRKWRTGSGVQVTGTMKWLLCLTLFSLTTSVNTDFNFQSADNGDFSFEFDMSNIQTDRHEDPMASIDLSALDAQLESLAGNDLDSLLEELKGYHGITDDSKHY